MAALVRQKEIAMTKTSAPTNSRTNSQTSASLILRTTVPAIVMSLAILLSALPTNAQDQQTLGCYPHLQQVAEIALRQADTGLIGE